MLYCGEGTLYDDKGNVCVTATGKYMKMPLKKIAEDFDADNDWFVVDKESDPKEICVGEE